MISELFRPCTLPILSESPLVVVENSSFCSRKNQIACQIKSSHVARVALRETNEVHTASRISRTARAKAEDALFDYLHYTRNLQFTDAEHISKNSPAFLQKLMLKIGIGSHTGISLSRFLRYHPINEFEAFFESSGLKPSEFSPLLPRNLIFLSDDYMLLENYCVLCSYGIPRGKIGKIYKVAKEIFGYGGGVLSSKLQAYEGIGLTKPMVIKLVTCCPSLLIGGVNGALIRVLEELKCFGIDHDWFVERLSEKNTYDWNQMLGMLYLLNKMDCSKNDFAKWLQNHSELLLNDSGRKVYALVALLLKLGLDVNKILGLLLQYPRVLSGNPSKNFWQAIYFMTELGMEIEGIAEIVQTHPHVLGSCSLMKPGTLLSRLGVEHETLCVMIKEDPHLMSNVPSGSNMSFLPVTDGRDSMYLVEKTNFLLKLGFVENSDEMIKALKRFRGRGDLLQERFDCLVDAGLDCHVVSHMIKMNPAVLNQCREVIELKIDYLVNCLGYRLETIVSFPTYLCYDIKRIKLRFSMCKWLREKGVLKSMLALSTILACSEARFVKYQVSLHPEGLEVWGRLKKSSSM